ncbi:alkaline phosphatase family protein [Clostridium sp. C8-1-8]|uniref:LTA synthase family protein n=1 Tax=Clostridium sp. C8-1-8 TaxID=2698831 RepID=UPI0013698534|nr:alkaline phosphatase family protein [Clostridium sp. C8-1-8]
MLRYIRKNINTIAIISLFVGVSLMNFSKSGNYLTGIYLLMVEMGIIFCLGILTVSINFKSALIISIINLAFINFNIRSNVYLLNVLFLSCVAWYVLTRIFMKNKYVFLILYVIGVSAIFLLDEVWISLALFVVVFYPIYLVGYMSRESSNYGNLKQDLLIGISIPINAFILDKISRLGDVFSGSKGVLVLNILNKDVKTSLVSLFVYIYSAIVAVSVGYLIYRALSITLKIGKKTNSLQNKTFKKNIVLNLNTTFILITLVAFSGDCILKKQLIYDFTKFFDIRQLINMLVLIVIYMLLISLIGANLGGLLFYFFSCAFLIANFIKLKYFDEPFYPWDIYLIKDAYMIGARYIDYRIMIFMSIAIVISLLIIIKFRKKIMLFFMPKPDFVMIILSVIVTGCSIYYLSYTKSLVNLGLGKSWYIGKQDTLQNGLFLENYFLMSDYKNYLADKPEEYSKEKIDNIVNKLNNHKEVEVLSDIDTKPNVVLIMSESFWDPTRLNGVKFDKDIIGNIRANEKGNILSPVFGGGTANVEFEALTGLSNYFTSPGVMPYNVYLRRITPSIATVFDRNDYETIAIHPNDGTFYNRDKVYKYLGFKKFIDIKGFDKNNDCKGTNVSDDKLVDKILKQLNDGDGPKFIFAVTMQNHDPYYKEYDKLEVNTYSDKLNETELSVISNYASGIYDADKAFGRLISSLKECGRPTLVYYFGDHLPRLGSPAGNYDVYNALNYFKDKERIEADINCYTTPLAAWSNYKSLSNIEPIISPAQLSLHILKESKVSYPVYFNILDEVRKTHPYLQNHINNRNIQNEEAVKDYKLIQYDLLFGDQYLSKN